MKSINCPICQIKISDLNPQFCKQCGWDFSNDFTIISTISPIPEKVKQDYNERLRLARKHWNEKQEVAHLKYELENEKKRIEQDKIYLENERRKIQTKDKEIQIEKEKLKKEKIEHPRKLKKQENLFNKSLIWLLNNNKIWDKEFDHFTKLAQISILYIFEIIFIIIIYLIDSCIGSFSIIWIIGRIFFNILTRDDFDWSIWLDIVLVPISSYFLNILLFGLFSKIAFLIISSIISSLVYIYIQLLDYNFVVGPIFMYLFYRIIGRKKTNQ